MDNFIHFLNHDPLKNILHVKSWQRFSYTPLLKCAYVHIHGYVLKSQQRLKPLDSDLYTG